MRPKLTLVAVSYLALSACSRPLAEPPQPTPEPTLAPTRISRPSTTEEKARALATSAELVQSGRCEEAVPLLEVLLSAYPEMEDYHLHHLGICAASLGEQGRAVESWSRLLSRYRESIHATGAALAWGTLLHRNGDDDAAAPLLRGVVTSEDPALVRAAQLQLAEIDLARTNVRAAYTMFTSLREDAAGETARKAKGYVLALRGRYPELEPVTAREREQEVRLLLREGDHDSALRLVNGILATAPAQNRPSILALRAQVQRAGGDSQQYLQTLREIYTAYPSSAQAPIAIFDQARWLWNKDSDDNAALVFREIERRFPRHDRMMTVRYALARIAQDAGDRATALQRFRALVERYPRSETARQARWQITWIHYYAGELRAAENELAVLARGRSAQSAPDVTYWRGRTLESAGRGGEARAIFESILERAPDSYYAIRAAERLGEPTLFSTDGAVARPAPFPPLPPPLQADFHLTRARRLHAAGLMSYGRREVRAFARNHSGQPRDFMIDLNRAVDGHRQALRLAGRNTAHYTELLYPLAFWNLVTESAARYRIDPFLSLSLMRQESLFDPEALSPANARGLMQLLPSTAEEVAIRIGRGGQIDLYDPATNIELGTAHLRELADMYDGDHVRILAAYNAGATAVAKWDSRFGTRARDEYVESITYNETRDYVKKVLANYRKYQRLYGTPASGVRDGGGGQAAEVP